LVVDASTMTNIIVDTSTDNCGPGGGCRVMSMDEL
jgi:hypothetical protein